MKIITISVFLLMALASTSAKAALCSTIEFAELDSFSKDELTKEYCSNKEKTAYIYSEANKPTEEISSSNSTVKNQMIVNKSLLHLKEIANCDDQNERIVRIMEKKKSKNDKPLNLSSCSK